MNAPVTSPGIGRSFLRVLRALRGAPAPHVQPLDPREEAILLELRLRRAGKTLRRRPPPQRMSVDDIGLDWREAADVVIYLDGVRQPTATFYDCKRGIVRRWTRRLTAAELLPMIEEVRGIVTVGWSDEA